MTVQLLLNEEGLHALFGIRDENLRRIESAYGVRVSARGGKVHIEGEPQATQRAEQLISGLAKVVERGYRLRAEDVVTAIRVCSDDPGVDLVDFFFAEGYLAPVRRAISPRSLNQQLYIRAMAEKDMVFAIGPAGTGKTYLAVAMAAAALMEKRVKRLVLARPAVEAGERLGFLPGDLVEKVNPYLRPLYDALYDLFGYEKVARLLERGAIEIAPLAFMRGRTLNDAFVILDEAQNTTREQMKMFLTRIGFGSKAVITGDITQTDLPRNVISGLREAINVLSGVEGLAFVYLDERDVVRHPLVQKIVNAYERFDAEKEPSR